MPAKTFTPIGRKVLVKMMDAPVESGGILLPDAVQKQSQIGIVVRLGTGALREDLKVGVKVLTPEYGGSVLYIDGVRNRILDEEDIIAVVEA